MKAEYKIIIASAMFGLLAWVVDIRFVGIITFLIFGIVVSMAIAECKNMEEKLRQSERRYWDFFRNSRDGFVVVDIQGCFIDANQAYCQMLGYSLDELKQKKSFYEITHPRWRDWEREEIWENRLLKDGYSGIYEKEYIRKDGTIFPVELQSYTMFDEKGSPQYLWGIARDITERKQAEKSLRESEERFRRIYENTTVGLARVSLDFHIEHANEAYCRMIGYNEDELVGKHIGDITHPEVLKENLRKQMQLAKGEINHYRMEKQFIHKNGSTIHGIIDANLVSDNEGKPLYFLGSVLDITDRKRAEEALKESEERLRRVVENMPVMMDALDENYNIIVWNRECERVTGYSAKEIVNNPHVLEIFYPDSEYRNQMIADLVSLGYDFRNKEYKITCKDGTKKTISWSNISAKFPIPGWFTWAIGVDVTERKNAEEALRESEERLKAFFDHSPTGLAIFDDKLHFVAINKTLANINGLPIEAHIGKSLKEIFPEIANNMEKNFKNIMLTGQPVLNVERTDTNYRGEVIHSIANFFPIPGQDGKPKAIGIIVLDISDIKRSEEEKKLLEEQIHQIQKLDSIGRLAGGVAHDFNNMLNVIIGRTEIAIEQVKPDQPIFVNLEEIRKAAERSVNLTRQLLAFARKQTISPKVVDLNIIVESMLKMLRRLIGEDIDLIWVPKPDLWHIKIDPSQIDQILANLCVNARDAITGIGKITIETGMITFDQAYCSKHPGFIPGDFVMLTVSDDGCGMDKNTIDKIFEPFFTTKGIGRGTGLGLATVYGIVKQNNGFINVYSEPNNGTTFKIYLPSYSLKTEQIQEKQDVPLSGGRETILLVEDEETILDMVEIMLKSLGYRVLRASTPGKAINIAKDYNGEIHLIITDVVMPEMNGRDLSEKLIAIYPKVKVLFMSGYTANIIAHRGVLDHGVNFIQKPFSIKELCAKVSEILKF